jgi:flagellar protein FliS
MGPAANAFNAYKQAEIETISQRDLLVKLYQGVERFLNIAMVGIANGEIESVNTNCQKAKRIFMELLSTLNMEVGGDVAVRLRDLYLFFIAEIVEGNLTKDRERIAKIMPVIATLREAWQGVPDEFANVSSLPQDSQGSTLNIRS